MKFSPTSMANMSRLFNGATDEQVETLSRVLEDEASAAGVLTLAFSEGLTMAQWEIVRDPRETVRAAVLAAGK